MHPILVHMHAYDVFVIFQAAHPLTTHYHPTDQSGRESQTELAECKKQQPGLIHEYNNSRLCGHVSPVALTCSAHAHWRTLLRTWILENVAPQVLPLDPGTAPG